MLIQSTITFWEISRGCTILVYVFDHHVFMDVYSHRENVKFVYLGESSDSEKMIAASIDSYFEKEEGYSYEVHNNYLP